MLLELEPIQQRGFRNVHRNGKAVGFQVGYRMPYYRGIPLCMSTGVDVKVDGESFARDQVTVTIQGRTYTQEEMKKISNVQWPNYVAAIFTVAKPGGLQLGVHEVEVTMKRRVSYFGPGHTPNYGPSPAPGEAGGGAEVGAAQRIGGFLYPAGGTTSRKLVLVR
jgi:hypothetical protein